MPCCFVEYIALVACLQNCHTFQHLAISNTCKNDQHKYTLDGFVSNDGNTRYARRAYCSPNHSSPRTEGKQHTSEKMDFYTLKWNASRCDVVMRLFQTCCALSVYIYYLTESSKWSWFRIHRVVFKWTWGRSRFQLLHSQCRGVEYEQPWKVELSWMCLWGFQSSPWPCSHQGCPGAAPGCLMATQTLPAALTQSILQTLCALETTTWLCDWSCCFSWSLRTELLPQRWTHWCTVKTPAYK